MVIGSISLLSLDIYAAHPFPMTNAPMIHPTNPLYTSINTCISLNSIATSFEPTSEKPGWKERKGSHAMPSRNLKMPLWDPQLVGTLVGILKGTLQGSVRVVRGSSPHHG